MKTNAIPAVIMLTAGFIDCILSLYEHVSLYQFTKRLLIVLLIFYVLGCVVKIILDINIGDESEEDGQDTEDGQEETVEENNEQDTENNDSVEEMEESENTDPDREDSE